MTKTAGADPGGVFRLLELLLEAWRIFWTNRGRAYTKIAIALIGVGGLATSTSVLVLIVQALTAAAGIPDNNAPWWATMGFGALVIAAGIGLFIFFHLRESRSRPTTDDDHIVISLVPDTSFQQAVMTVGAAAKRAVQLEGFSDEEMDAILREVTVWAKTESDLLLQLGALSANIKIGEYEVLDHGGPMVVRRK